MDIENLIRMANRIGEFFEALPDVDEARAGIANHLKRFWEPRMRRQILAHVDQASGAGLHPLVREAISANRELLDDRKQQGSAVPAQTGTQSSATN